MLRQKSYDLSYSYAFIKKPLVNLISLHQEILALVQSVRRIGQTHEVWYFITPNLPHIYIYISRCVITIHNPFNNHLLTSWDIQVAPYFALGLTATEMWGMSAWIRTYRRERGAYSIHHLGGPWEPGVCVVSWGWTVDVSIQRNMLPP